MPYAAIALISVIIFTLVHLSAKKSIRLNQITHGRFLSASGGVAIAYVFVDLLPKLCTSNVVVSEALLPISPFFERHVFVMALISFLLFFIVDRSPKFLPKKAAFWLSFSAYALFNFLVGYSVVDKDDPEVQPLALFTFAIALEYFINDYALSKIHGKDYERLGKWILVVSLFLGWMIGVWTQLPQTAIGIVSAFIGGGVVMNVTRHELPKEIPHSLLFFLLGAVFYTALLLAIG